MSVNLDLMLGAGLEDLDTPVVAEIVVDDTPEVVEGVVVSDSLVAAQAIAKAEVAESIREVVESEVELARATSARAVVNTARTNLARTAASMEHLVNIGQISSRSMNLLMGNITSSLESINEPVLVQGSLESFDDGALGLILLNASLEELEEKQEAAAGKGASALKRFVTAMTDTMKKLTTSAEKVKKEATEIAKAVSGDFKEGETTITSSLAVGDSIPKDLKAEVSKLSTFVSSVTTGYFNQYLKQVDRGVAIINAGPSNPDAVASGINGIQFIKFPGATIAVKDDQKATTTRTAPCLGNYCVFSVEGKDPQPKKDDALGKAEAHMAGLYWSDVKVAKIPSKAKGETVALSKADIAAICSSIIKLMDEVISHKAAEAYVKRYDALNAASKNVYKKEKFAGENAADQKRAAKLLGELDITLYGVCDSSYKDVLKAAVMVSQDVLSACSRAVKQGGGKSAATDAEVESGNEGIKDVAKNVAKKAVKVIKSGNTAAGKKLLDHSTFIENNMLPGSAAHAAKTAGEMNHAMMNASHESFSDLAIVKAIRNLKNSIFTKNITPRMIAEAEADLHLRFADEYGDLMLSFGRVIADGVELTTVGKSGSGHTNVVVKTREGWAENRNVPHNCYVVEDLYIDGIMIWQDESGAIYQSAPNKQMVKIFDSLSDYIASRTK